MLFYPKEYFDRVTKITIDFLNKNNIKAIILDVDNTIIDFDKNMPEDIKKWCLDLKKQGIKFCIVSNTNKLEKVKKAAETLDLPYFYFAKKPSKGGFKKAIALLNEKAENIAAVGDQIFTDVLGANRCNLYPILVKPVDKRDIFTTKLKRPIENIVIKRYLESIREE